MVNIEQFNLAEAFSLGKKKKRQFYKKINGKPLQLVQAKT